MRTQGSTAGDPVLDVEDGYGRYKIDYESLSEPWSSFSNARRNSPQARKGNTREVQGRRSDYTCQLTGNVNLLTDVKEATFWGNVYVLSGSDDGKVYIWNRRSGSLTNVLVGSHGVINVVRGALTLKHET